MIKNCLVYSNFYLNLADQAWIGMINPEYVTSETKGLLTPEFIEAHFEWLDGTNVTYYNGLHMKGLQVTKNEKTTPYVLGDKMNSTVVCVNCFLRVPLVCTCPTALFPAAKASIRNSQKI